MLRAATPYRHDEGTTPRVPVVLPRVEVAIDGDGVLRVLLDGDEYAGDRALGRSDLQWVLDEITSEVGTAVRVEVSEPDGSSYTDIVMPPNDDAPSTPVEADSPGPGAAICSAFGISGEGFTPGEEVAVAVVVADRVASEDGTAQLRLPPALLADEPHVVLIGRSSCAVAVSHRS